MKKGGWITPTIVGHCHKSETLMVIVFIQFKKDVKKHLKVIPEEAFLSVHMHVCLSLCVCLCMCSFNPVQDEMLDMDKVFTQGHIL